MSQIEDISIWDGTTGPVSGSTPFGFYDNDVTFVTHAPLVADACAKHLGYPIVDIELQDINFFAAFESAVTEYSYQINMLNIKDNMLHIMGASTGSTFNNKNITPTLQKVIEISREYGTEAGSGGSIDWHTGSFSVVSGQQRYDLDEIFTSVTHPSESIEIKKIYHNASPAINRYFDPFVGTGMGGQSFLNTMGMGGMSPGVSFMMMPLYDDLLRIQHIEFNDTIRKSGFGFRLINNNLQIFPIPTANFTMHFEYIINSERANPIKNSATDTVSDSSNVPYTNITFSTINSVGRAWIFKYASALAKEMLGQVRGKYQSIPIPNADTTLNGQELISEANQEKEILLTQLREDLVELSRKMQMEKARDESDFIQEQLQKIPLGIYLG